MATVIQLALDDKLVKLDPQLEATEQEWRSIHILPSVQSTFEKDLLTWKSQWQIETTPLQQIDALLEVFCSGERLTFGNGFKPLNYLGKGVWELKTPDVRIFGWFPVRDCFIGAFLDTAFHVKTHNLYPGYAGQTVRLRNQLGLDEPKFVPGDDPNVVVSNFTYP